MCEESKERISQIKSSRPSNASFYLSPKGSPGFFGKVISTLKSNNMDFLICESIYLFRIKSILEKSRKRKNERKSTIFDCNYLYNQDIEQIIPKIFKILEVDGQIIFLSLFLLEKIIFKYKIILDEEYIIKYVVISLVETIKFNVDDSNIDSNIICSILKIDKEMFINLEFKFLRIIDYNLKIDKEKFFLYKQKIMMPWIDYLKSLL